MVATAHARTGHVADTRRLLATTEPRGLHSQVQMLAQVANALALAGRLDDAQQMATDAELLIEDIDSEDRDRPLDILAGAFARAGQLQHAEELAGDINDADWRSWAEANVVDALAEASELDSAARLAKRIYRDSTRDSRLGYLASAFLRAGRRDEAESLANEVADITVRANALSEMALQLAESGDRSAAAQLVAAAWSLDSWSNPIPALVVLDSGSVLAVFARTELLDLETV